MTDLSDFDGCARACRKSGAHTLVWGDCEHAPESARPVPTISIGRVEPDLGDGYPGIVMRSIPLPAWEAAITVLKWVSRGKTYALDADPDIAPSYPDAVARRALGALHDAGLLGPAPAPAATEATGRTTRLDVLTRDILSTFVATRDSTGMHITHHQALVLPHEWQQWQDALDATKEH